jgi:hypothetical protein
VTVPRERAQGTPVDYYDIHSSPVQIRCEHLSFFDQSRNTGNHSAFVFGGLRIAHVHTRVKSVPFFMVSAPLELPCSVNPCT